MKRLYDAGTSGYPVPDQGVPSYLDYNGRWIPLAVTPWDTELNLRTILRNPLPDNGALAFLSDSYRSLVLFTATGLYCFTPAKPLWGLGDGYSAKESGQMWCSEFVACRVPRSRALLWARHDPVFYINIMETCLQPLCDKVLAQTNARQADGSWRATFTTEDVAINIHWAYTRKEEEPRRRLMTQKYWLLRAFIESNGMPCDLLSCIFGSFHHFCLFCPVNKS